MSPAKTASKPSLSRSTVADRAIELADAEGLEAVTARRLAAELGVTPMALYWHFRTKDDLLAGAADRVLESLVLPEPSPDGWVAEIRQLLNALITALRQHPQLAHLIGQRVMATEPGLILSERAMSALMTGGFTAIETGQLAVHAMRVAIALVTDDAVDASGIGPDEREQHLRAKRAMLGSLDPARFPTLLAVAEPLTYCDDIEGFYALGAEHFVAGLEQLAASR